MDVEAKQSTENMETFVTGQVKWFNARTGYGFITAIDGEDIFVHAKDLKPLYADTLHPTLFTGEYVQFQLGPADKKDGVRAVNVTGIRGKNGPGALLCDHGRLKFFSYNKRQFSSEPSPASPGQWDRGVGRTNMRFNKTLDTEAEPDPPAPPPPPALCVTQSVALGV